MTEIINQAQKFIVDNTFVVLFQLVMFGIATNYVIPLLKRIWDSIRVGRRKSRIKALEERVVGMLYYKNNPQELILLAFLRMLHVLYSLTVLIVILTLAFWDEHANPTPFVTISNRGFMVFFAGMFWDSICKARGDLYDYFDYDNRRCELVKKLVKLNKKLDGS